MSMLRVSERESTPAPLLVHSQGISASHVVLSDLEWSSIKGSPLLHSFSFSNCLTFPFLEQDGQGRVGGWLQQPDDLGVGSRSIGGMGVNRETLMSLITHYTESLSTLALTHFWDSLAVT